jgi:CheY-like chemotaxis protein
VLDLNALVRDAETVARGLLPANVELVAVPAPDLAPVRADPNLIGQALLNLVVNARDAMPHGGRLTLATANVHLDETFVQKHLDLPAGEYVQVAVSDTGVGMTRAVLARLFEPFFTTKEVGQGTGLGLSTAYGIVKQAGGDIEVESEPGRGSTFKVFLPRLGSPATSPALACGLPAGSETVLLVDDEPMVRVFARMILQQCGYRVLEADGGPSALRAVAGYSEGIDLLVTDVVMSPMGGRELAEQLQALRPGLKVLFISGYARDSVLRNRVAEEEVAFLPKPFSPEVLARKVREVLDR